MKMREPDKNDTRCEICDGEGWWTDAEPSMNPDGSPDFSNPIPIRAACDCDAGKEWDARSFDASGGSDDGDLPF